MSYEIRHQQNEESKKPTLIEHLGKMYEQEEKEIRGKYKIPDNLKLYKSNGDWRMLEMPHILVSEWRTKEDEYIKAEQEYQKDVDALYKDNDNSDLYPKTGLENNDI